jgi:hypothetical protein
MTTRPHRPAVPLHLAQLPMVFTPSRLIEQRQRAEVVALLSRLLLQVATAQSDEEVDDEQA